MYSGNTLHHLRPYETLAVLWQSDNSEALTSAPTPSLAQSNASFRSRGRPGLSSKRSRSFGRRIAGSGLAAAKVRFPGKCRLRKKAG
jgi:hypothetical protein